MNDGFTKTEAALLDALHRERALLRQRELLNGVLLHEMANAVTYISGSAELLRLAKSSPQQQAKLLGSIEAGARTLKELLGGVRSIIGVDAEVEERQSVDLVAFVRAVASDPAVTGGAAVERVRLEVAPGMAPTAVCVPLLRHALGNLVRNGLAYSPPESVVRIKLGPTPKRGICIHVLNRGNRLPSNFAQAAFEPRRKSRAGGMGFGLYIVQTAMHRSGGRVVFGSTQAGTVFSLLLDGAEPEDGRPADPAGAAGRIARGPTHVFALREAVG